MQVLLAVSVLFVLAGPVLMALPSRAGRVEAAVPAAPLPDEQAVRRSVEAPGPAPECAITPEPREVTIPALCIRAPIETTTVRRAELVLPHDVRRVFKWDGGASLDARSGTTLLAAHVRVGSLGEGPFGDLASIHPGDEVVTRAKSGRSVRWRVVTVKAYSRVALPDEVWAGPAGPRRLVLVTCGGPVLPDGRGFRDNVVVTAVPARA